MKNLLLFLAAAMLSCATNSFAKETERVKSFSNEEFFSQADIIVEAKPPSNWTSFIYSYDAFGNYNRDDIYTSSYHIVTYIYKNNSGINIVPGDTLNLIAKGGSIFKGATIYEEEKITSFPQTTEPFKIAGYPSVYFLKKSDFPENPDINKWNKHPKVSPIQRAKKIPKEATDFDSLHLKNRYELYKYMEQFDGVTVSQLNDPEQIWWDLNGDMEVFNQYRKERNITWKLFNERTKEEIQAEMDSINSLMEMKVQRARENREKKNRAQGLLKAPQANNVLTVSIQNQRVDYDKTVRKYYFHF